MSKKNLLEDGTVLTLGLVGAVAAVGALANRRSGSRAYGENARIMVETDTSKFFKNRKEALAAAEKFATSLFGKPVTLFGEAEARGTVKYAEGREFLGEAASYVDYDFIEVWLDLGDDKEYLAYTQTFAYPKKNKNTECRCRVFAMGERDWKKKQFVV